MQVVDKNLHLLPWTRETGPNINPVPATSYSATNVPMGSGNALLVTNYSAKDGGADLVTCKRPIPQLTGYALNFLRLRCKMFISSIDKLNLGRLETDMKVCLVVAPPTPAGKPTVTIPNVANGSTQVNFTNGGWQIDGNPPGWVFTKFAPVIPTDAWFDYYHDLQINPATKTFTVLGCGFGAQAYKTSSPDPQNVAWQTTNWQDLVLAIQLQLMVLKAGTVNVAYDQMDAVWSDQLIQ